MNIRQAILLAADQIEKDPANFKFVESDVPKDCGSPGCAIGWIGHFYGGFRNYSKVVTELFGHPDQYTFYNRMTELEGVVVPKGEHHKMKWAYGYWPHSAAICAKTLRKYADKYHPAEPIKFPDWNKLAMQPLESNV